MVTFARKIIGMRYLSFIALVLLMSSCTFNAVEQDAKLDSYFQENNLKGSFALMDNGTGLTYSPMVNGHPRWAHLTGHATDSMAG